MNATEFLESKGWNKSDPVIGGALFTDIVLLLEEFGDIKYEEGSQPDFLKIKDYKK